MQNPYENCPVFESETYRLRLIEEADAPDLFLVYSDEKAVPYFNSDNCNGDTFHYTLPEHMQGAIAAWKLEYARQGFVRWTIVDKNIGCAVGTIELFNRKADDYYNDCAILRLDLRSDYEQEAAIYEILSLIVPKTCALFACQMIATKVKPFAAERRAAVERLGFTASGEPLIGGHDRKVYTDYFVLHP
ncbi:MAG: GNAT family N-acetyltransferase [Lachnospiraceae bacterium]|nr:GNAT family N-acetyltransferase [Lachnospiraceae bacterium]